MEVYLARDMGHRTWEHVCCDMGHSQHFIHADPIWDPVRPVRLPTTRSSDSITFQPGHTFILGTILRNTDKLVNQARWWDSAPGNHRPERVGSSIATRGTKKALTKCLFRVDGGCPEGSLGTAQGVGEDVHSGQSEIEGDHGPLCRRACKGLVTTGPKKAFGVLTFVKV